MKISISCRHSRVPALQGKFAQIDLNGTSGATMSFWGTPFLSRLILGCLLGCSASASVPDQLPRISLRLHNECAGPYLAKAFARCCEIYERRGDGKERWAFFSVATKARAETYQPAKDPVPLRCLTKLRTPGRFSEPPGKARATAQPNFGHVSPSTCMSFFETRILWN